MRIQLLARPILRLCLFSPLARSPLTSPLARRLGQSGFASLPFLASSPLRPPVFCAPPPLSIRQGDASPLCCLLHLIPAASLLLHYCVCQRALPQSHHLRHLAQETWYPLRLTQNINFLGPTSTLHASNLECYVSSYFYQSLPSITAHFCHTLIPLFWLSPCSLTSLEWVIGLLRLSALHVWFLSYHPRCFASWNQRGLSHLLYLRFSFTDC